MALKTLSRRSRVELPGGAYDVRGWQVRTQLDGEKVGTVEEMLVDEHDHPHLLDVDVGALRRHVLLPLSEAHADPVEHVVWIDRLDKDRLKDLPEYDRSPERLSSAFEERLLEEYRVLAAGNGSGHGRTSTLARLGDLKEHRVSKGVSDPRGWKVLGGDGQTIGEVEELIVDKTEMTTRYLDCSVDEKRFELEPLSRHVLIPVEHVRLHRDEKKVLVDGLFGRDLKQYPVYSGLPLASADESRLHAMFGSRRHSSGTGGGADHFFAGDRAVTHEVDAVGPVDTLGTRVERVHHVRAGDQDVRIRISGSDIIIEKQGPGGENDG